jgi:TP901 family phage tail tape measure protein
LADDPGGAGGYMVGSAYVQVDPNAEGFAEALEEQIAGVDLVVTIPVVPDASGLQAGVDSAVADSKATVVVPVTADPAGLQESIDAASKDSGATVVVPMEADPAGLAAQADEAADAAAGEAGSTFAERFSAVAGQMSLFAPDEGAMSAEGGAAGQGAGAGFGDAFSAAAGTAGAGLGAELTPDATAAGREAGTGLGGAFAEAVSASVSAAASAWGALTPAAEAEGGQAGGAAGGAFTDAFGAALSARVAAVLEEELTAPAGWAGSAAGLSAGTGFTEAMTESVTRAVAATSAAWGEIPVAAEAAARAAVSSTVSAWGAIIPPAETAGTGAGEAAGTGFMSRLASMLSGVTSMFSGMIPGAGTEGAAAGEAAGTGFASRFAAIADSVTGAMSGLIPGMAAEGEEAGTAAGEGFASRFRSIIMGDISPMEALMGAGFIAVAADMASKFQSAMEMVHTQAGVAQSAIGNLSGSVLALAGQVGISPDSLAETLYHVESAFQSTGITGQKAMDLVKVAAEGARTGGADVVDVVNALDGAMVSGIGGISNYQQAMGALNAIVGSGDMKMQDLADAMGTGIVAVAKSYGQNIYQVGAALATFGDNNIRGAKAATDLRMAMQAILQPVSTAGDALHQLGLTSTQLGNTMTHQGLTAALAQFVDHLKASKVPMDDWGNYITEIFGKKAGAGINVLIDQLSRMQGKLPDIEKGAHDFGSAWAATQATTSQKFKELESGLEALMIKIGAGLLPAVDALMGEIVKNLPAIEHFGGELAKVAAPVVTLFFDGLKDILGLLFGPMKKVTLAVIALAGAFALFSAINPWVALIAGLVILVGAIVKYHEEIWHTIKSTWDKVAAFFKKFWPELAIGAVLFFGPVMAGMIALAALIIKYHKQILGAVEKTWDEISKYTVKVFEGIVKGVEKLFDDVKKAITTGFDAWWKSHGAEVEAVWKVVWKVISDWFTVNWDIITGTLKIAWALVGPFIKVGLAEVEMAWKITWALLSEIFRNTWDVIAAVVKVAVAGVTAVIKIAWDLIVGVFSVFLDLVTGHWSKAWTDIQNAATQVWNAIQQYLGTVWDTISGLAIQVWNNISSFFTTTLNAVEGFFESAWNTIWSTIKRVWNDISGWFTTWWNDEVEGWEKIVSTVEGWLKDAWNTVWGDAKTVWNAIHQWFTTWWGNEVQGWKTIVTTVEGWLKTAWSTIKQDAVTGFDEVRKGIKTVWDGILNDIESIVGQIKNAISTVTSLPGKVLSGIGIHLARGGVIPGYAPGRDSVHAMLSPGEGVIVPEAVRAMGGKPAIDAINSHFTAQRAFAFGGVVVPRQGASSVPDPYAGAFRHYADGGIAGGGLSAFGAGQAAGQQYSAMESMGHGGSGGDGLTAVFNYYGPQAPTAEQQQAMMSRLALLVGAM